jgi:hypothetical protein
LGGDAETLWVLQFQISPAGTPQASFYFGRNFPAANFFATGYPLIGGHDGDNLDATSRYEFRI